MLRRTRSEVRNDARPIRPRPRRSRPVPHHRTEIPHREPERNDMRHSTRRGLATGAFALSAALILAACSGGGGTRRRPATTTTPASSPRSSCSSSGCRRRSSPATSRPSTRASSRTRASTVEIIPSGGDIVPQDALANGDVDFAIAWVPKVLGSIEAGREPHRHRADLPALRHPPGLVGGLGHRARSPTSRARRSARGASATSGRSSPRWRPRTSTRRPSRSSRRTST